MASYSQNWPPGLTLRPIEQWPGEFTALRREAPFRATLSNTIAELDRELRMIDPKDTQYPPAILQISIRERDFRVDGMPRADARPAHPGVILSIEPRNRPAVSFPCDTFFHWHDNLRAITLTLEALRKIDRYGVTKNGQQYRGWQAIEARPTVDARAAAASFLARLAWPDCPPDVQGRRANELVVGGDGGRDTYRQARRNAHPDRNNADQTLWDQVEAAAAVLGVNR